MACLFLDIVSVCVLPYNYKCSGNNIKLKEAQECFSSWLVGAHVATRGVWGQALAG